LDIPVRRFSLTTKKTSRRSLCERAPRRADYERRMIAAEEQDSEDEEEEENFD
jgi:hypothetical protein